MPYRIITQAHKGIPEHEEQHCPLRPVVCPLGCATDGLVARALQEHMEAWPRVRVRVRVHVLLRIAVCVCMALMISITYSVPP